MPRVVVLASGTGSTVQAILDDPVLRPFVVAVGSERVDCPALQRAQTVGVDTFRVPFDASDRPGWNRALEQAISAYDPDLVVLAGFMRLLDAELVNRFRIVNTHPALSPAFPGAHAIRDALAAGVTQTGVTVHWVDAGMDTGAVITQIAVRIEPDDDEDTLRARVQAAEKPLYRQAITTLCQEFDQK